MNNLEITFHRFCEAYVKLLQKQRHDVQSRVVRMKNSSLRSQWSFSTLTGKRARGRRIRILNFDNPDDEPDLAH